jgi:hypothetical protein
MGDRQLWLASSQNSWETPELDRCFFFLFGEISPFFDKEIGFFLLEFSYFSSVNSTIFFFWASFAKISIPKKEKRAKKKKKKPGTTDSRRSSAESRHVHA